MSTTTTAAAPLRIGYVPEHYLAPLHLAVPHFGPSMAVRLVAFPSGTGHMIAALRADELDLAIGLTEGWVAGLLTPEGQRLQGYRVVGSWVRSPLRWAVVTGRDRADIQTVRDLQAHRRVGVSRLGSGSHIMAFVLALQEGWLSSSTPAAEAAPLELVPLGPFENLRDGVTGDKGGEGGEGGEPPKADFFMWEHFTTKPYFDSSSAAAPLKKIGELYTPWPSWHIAASTRTFPDPAADARLAAVFGALDQGVEDFYRDLERAVRLLGTGELGCRYSEADAREWLEGVEFVRHGGGTCGVSRDVMQGVIDVLVGAGVVGRGAGTVDGAGVVGIERGN